MIDARYRHRCRTRGVMEGFDWGKWCMIGERGGLADACHITRRYSILQRVWRIKKGRKNERIKSGKQRGGDGESG